MNEEKDEGVRTRVEPLGDRIIVQVLEDEKVSAGGVVIPDNARERPQRGKVLAVGPGRFEPQLRREQNEPEEAGVSSPYFGSATTMLHAVEYGGYAPMPVVVGDVVLFSKYGGTEVPGGGLGGPMDQVQHLILREGDLLGVERYEDADGTELSHDVAEVRRARTRRFVEQATEIDGGVGERVRARDLRRGRTMTPQGMEPMPETGAATPYELITLEQATAQGLRLPGRQQEERGGHVYDFKSQCYWPSPDRDEAEEAGDQ